MSRLILRFSFIGILFFGLSAGAEGRPEMQRAVMVHMKQVNKCYNDALKKMPKPKTGKMTLEWAINEQGQASHVIVAPKKTTIRDPHLESCLIAKVKTWKLPPASKGQTSFVSFPFYFNKRAPAKAHGTAPAKAPKKAPAKTKH